MDLHYKIHADSDHVAKFQGDRSRELGERVAKKRKEKKHHEHFISPPVTTVNGRPKKLIIIMESILKLELGIARFRLLC